MKKFKPGYNDPKGILIEAGGSAVGGLFASGTTVPTDGTSGYAPGCIFIDNNASGVAAIFINVGTYASCDFNVLNGGLDLAALTATAAELNTLHNQTLTTGAGAGFTGGTGTIYKNRVQLSGGIYETQILFDLTGLASSTTDLDIIGVGTSGASMGQITVAQNGTLLGGTLTCLEVPAGGVTDIDLYWGTVPVAATSGRFDDAVSGVSGTALITNGGAWTLALTKAIADPVGIANGYLYLTCGAGGTAATYTAGKYLLTLYGT